MPLFFLQDPKLAEHLARWGIDVLKVEKTDKTMAELEVCVCVCVRERERVTELELL